MSPALLWFRQDLRLHDLPALEAALAAGRPIIPVYIHDDAFAPGGASRWWLHHSLQSLSASLHKLGSRLVIRHGTWAEELKTLRSETGAEDIFASRMHEPKARRAERAIPDLRLLGGSSLFNPDLIKSQTGTIFGVYTPFARACLAQPEPHKPTPAPNHIPAPPTWPESLTSEQLGLLPRTPNWAAGWEDIWQPGEAGAAHALNHFKQGAIEDYSTDRDRPDRAGTSRLSPHLHFGEISPAALWHATTSSETYRRELLWREFAFYLLWHRPELPDRCLRPEFEKLPWREDPKGLRAWQRGQTGIPIVDAGMRELWQTGYMHNRVRMVVGSFLTKHLLIPWQEGAEWFLDTLIDADLAANSTNWQWVSGCGVESQPFFRIFNPTLQGEKFDPDGAYVRRYVPELAKIPPKFIHSPWLLSDLERAAIDYPPLLIDLPAGRARALAAFEALK